METIVGGMTEARSLICDEERRFALGVVCCFLDFS